jgi:hypothetical protein
MPFSRLHEAGFVREDDGVYPVGRVQLHQDAGDVGLDRRVGEEDRRVSRIARAEPSA